MLKYTYYMGPDEMQLAMSYILLPWDFKILFGICADTVKLPFMSHSPKRAFLMMISCSQALAYFFTAFYEYETYIPLLILQVIGTFCGAFMDTIIDGITCIQQKNDPISGA